MTLIKPLRPYQVQKFYFLLKRISFSFGLITIVSGLLGVTLTFLIIPKLKPDSFKIYINF
jgi:hypothetical protein